MENTTNIDHMRELANLVRTTFDDITREINEMGPAKDIIEITGTDSQPIFAVCPQEFQMTLRKLRTQKKPGHPQYTDVRQIILIVSMEGRELHEWLTTSLRKKLDTPILELAISLDWIRNIFVSTDLNTDEIPKVSVEVGSEEFPRKSFNPARETAYQDLYFRFVEIVIQVIREFWTEKGKEIIQKKIADSLEKAGGNTTAAVAKTLDGN